MQALHAVAAALWFALAGSEALAAGSPALFDTPVHEEHLPLPPDPLNPGAKAELSCFYYPGFMVKQVDLGEVGADQLSIVPWRDKAARPPCQRQNVKGEKVIPGDVWSGYFKGVKQGYVFLDAADGLNGGIEFAVFEAWDASRIFESVAVKFHGIDVLPSGSSGRDADNISTRLRYTSLYQAPCSLRTDGKSCWRAIRQATGLTGASPPDCRASYESAERRTPDRVAEVDSDPTVIEYEVEVVLTGWQVTRVTPASRATRCFAAE